MRFKSADGTEVEAFVTKPPGYVAGRRYPTILHIHGGPVGQFAWGYDVKTQYFAANGYVVVEPNPRGSTGRGAKFVSAIHRTWGITDYDDVIAAVDHAIAAGYADPGAAGGVRLFLRRLHDEYRHHADHALQGGGLRGGPQLHRRQLRS